MAQQQEPPSSSSQTLDISPVDLHLTSISPSTDTTNPSPSLTRNVSLSRLNAKAPEFVPRTTTAAAATSSSGATSSTHPRMVISPPPTSPGIIHVYPSPNSPFHAPIPVQVPVQNHHGHHHHHHVPVQYHHHVHQNQNHNHNHSHGHNNNNNNNHPRAFSGGTGFIDQKDVGSGQRTGHGEPDLKDGLTDEATQKIINQVEYYFSDINLATTDHLMRFINKDPEGYVPISVVVAFKKIKALVSSNAQLATILRNSGKLVVSEDGKKVKRLDPLTEADMEELQARIIVAENLPDDHCHQNLMKIFSAVGSVKTIRTCQPQASNGGATSASRGAKADGMLFSNKLHAFVEYESIESAEKAALELNKEGNWRHGLRVRLLRRPPQAKPAQPRGKKSGQEDDTVHKEDDTSTSEQHSVNEKHLDDTCQQSDASSHEHLVEDQPNDKEGGHKKGRNRGRGKGRGRPQFNHHNNRGAHTVTPPSTNPVNTEHSIVGKQPPGPRMPDGTRGFSMGRGKPVDISIS